LSLEDLTEPSSSGEVHAVRLLYLKIIQEITRSGWPRALVLTGERVVSAQENYGLLGYDPAEITLGSEHTRWVSESTLLRTQTTSRIPAALKEAALRRRPGERVMLAAPGITYRRDTRDRWHCAEPHQMDIWVLGDPQSSTHDNLLKLVGDILTSAVPGQSWEYIASPHHYTEGGIEVNVINNSGRVEVLECGRIARSLLQRLEIDPDEHGGLALGMGLDRLVMLHKGIPDIRLLRDANPRVHVQMFDLLPWKAVSRLPSISRDLSLAVTPDQSEETLTERMLSAAGDCAIWIEEMQVKGRWKYADLPEQAIERLGLLPEQENVLLRIVLRDCSRSITAEEANALYERIQAQMHEGLPGGGYRIRT
jgi:phenylalanyl-tRNA synthetase alpha chain